MDFVASSFNKFSGDNTEEKDTKNSKPTTGANKPSTGELLADAKVVAEATRAQFNNQAEKIDKDKAAEAAADLLDAAQKYGKMDEKAGMGKYVEQAETYLHNYNGPNTTNTPNSTTTGTDSPAVHGGKPESTNTSLPVSTTTDAPAVDGGEPESGSTDYAKMAQGFMKKF